MADISCELYRRRGTSVERRSRSQNGSLWLSSDVIAAKRERRRLEKKRMTTRSENDRFICHRCCCRATSKLINNSRHNFFRRRLSWCKKSASKWKIAKELLHTVHRDKIRSHSVNHTLSSTFSLLFFFKIHTINQARIKKQNFSQTPPTFLTNLSLILPSVYFFQSPTLKPSNSLPAHQNPHQWILFTHHSSCPATSCYLK